MSRMSSRTPSESARSARRQGPALPLLAERPAPSSSALETATPPPSRWNPISLELRPPDRPQPRRAGEGGTRPPHRDMPHEPLTAVFPGATPAAVSTSQRWGGLPPLARHLAGCRGEARRNERGGGRGRWWGDKEG
jgi:hypothetical protein